MKISRFPFNYAAGIFSLLLAMNISLSCQKEDDTQVSIEAVDATHAAITVRAKANRIVNFKAVMIDVVPDIIKRLENPGSTAYGRKYVSNNSDTFETTFDCLSLNQTYYFVAEFIEDGRHYYSEEISIATHERKTFEIPDENFRRYVVDRYGSDGTITEGQARSVEYLDLSNLAIRNLEGLNHFRNIRTLILDGNLIDSLDISLCLLGQKPGDFDGYKELRRLSCSDCSNLRYMKIWTQASSTGASSMDTITANRNTLLESADILISEIKYLNCNDNNLKEIRFLTDRKGAENTDCHVLYCANNQIIQLVIFFNQEINCSHNRIKSYSSNADYLDISYNELTYLSLKDCYGGMELLHCQGNPELKEVLVPNESFCSHIDDLLKDSQTKFVW